MTVQTTLGSGWWYPPRKQSFYGTTAGKVREHLSQHYAQSTEQIANALGRSRAGIGYALTALKQRNEVEQVRVGYGYTMWVLL